MDDLDVFENRAEILRVADAEVALRPATLRQLPALRRLSATATEVLADPDLGAAVAARAEALAADLAALTDSEAGLWLDAPWGETVVAMLAVLRVNSAYVAGPFAARIDAAVAAIRGQAGAS